MYEGSIRLAGGTINKNGRVEVCYNGIWGTVCGNDSKVQRAHPLLTSIMDRDG